MSQPSTSQGATSTTTQARADEDQPEVPTPKWGELPPPARIADLEARLTEWEQLTMEARGDRAQGKGRSSFDCDASQAWQGGPLTGADVFYLVARAAADSTEQVAIEAAAEGLRATPYSLDLPALHLEGADLTSAHLEGADLRDAYLAGAYLHSAYLERAGLGDAHLEGADLRYAHLKRAGLDDAHLEGADLSGAHLESVSFYRAHLDGADLSRAYLDGAYLRDAYLEGAHLDEAHLEGAHLSKAHLERADLGGASMQEADLHDAYLEGANLSGAHLERANLIGGHLERAKLRKANLEGTDLTSAYLEGANLSGAHLEGADFIEANLEGADLSGAYFDKASHLNDAVLTGASFDQITFDNTNLTVVDWSLVDILGDERIARVRKNSRGEPKSRLRRLDDYKAAVRANRVLAVALQAQGLSEDADRFAYRARLLQRRVLRLQGFRKFGSYLFSLLIAALAGYGYRLWRIVVVYSLTVGLFAAGYLGAGILASGQTPTGQVALNAIQISLNAIHGRVFFAQFGLDTLQSWLATVESILGIVIEGTFVAMLIQRFFGR
jgi:uncharacterized protein YjbI with pentapeptide repeats